MLAYAISDLHGRLPEVPECDLLVIAGDVCPDFQLRGAPYWSMDENKQAEWLKTKFRRWLINVPAEKVIGIAGNHDFVFEHDFMLPELPWTYLKDSGVEYRGVKFWGTPWVPNLARWAFYATETMLRARVESIPNDIDVLVTHGPPFGCGDKTKYDSNVGDVPMHVALRDGKLRPNLIITGHIHEARGKHTSDFWEGPLYNVSHLDENYENPRAPVLLKELL